MYDLIKSNRIILYCVKDMVLLLIIISSLFSKVADFGAEILKFFPRENGNFSYQNARITLGVFEVEVSFAHSSRFLKCSYRRMFFQLLKQH